MLQVVLNSLASAACYSLVAMGLSAVYAVRRFFHLAQGVIIALAAYLFLTFSPRMPWYWALLISLCAVALISLVIDFVIYSPLQKRKATSVALLLASLGLLTAGQNVISLIWGDAIRRFPGSVSVSRVEVLGAWLSDAQVYGLCVGILVWCSLALVMRLSGGGRLFQAVADDEELARSFGVNSSKVKTSVTVAAGLLGGIAGIIIGADMGITPALAFKAVVSGIAAAIAGGLGFPLKAAAGAVIIALSQNISALFLPGEWQDSVTYLLLLLLLCIRTS